MCDTCIAGKKAQEQLERLSAIEEGRRTAQQKEDHRLAKKDTDLYLSHRDNVARQRLLFNKHV